MADNVSLHIDGRKIEHFLSYSVESNLFMADDAFRLELANPEVEITEGSRCTLKVNEHLELNGIADRISESYDKAGRKLTLEGRDLMGLLTDSYCETFEPFKDKELKELAQELVSKVPFIKREDIRYGKGNKNDTTTLAQKKEIFESVQIEPGQTVFEVLKDLALARGLLFYAMPDGTFIFGEASTSEKAEYSLINRKSGRGNNVISGDRTRDISRRYSKIVVMSQKQGIDDRTEQEINVKEELPDPSVPFYKPYVTSVSTDGQDLKKYAKTIQEGQQSDGLSLGYRTYGHSQNNRNWQVNAICHVEDEIFKINGDFLITARTFEMSKEGAYTTLQLSKPGVRTG